MSFFIRYRDCPEPDTIAGEIILEDTTEYFESSVTVFSKENYQAQWREAIKFSTDSRRLSCLLTDIQLSDKGEGWINFFSLIPSEFARGSEKYDIESSGFYITQTIWTVTNRPETLLNRRYVELEDGTILDEVAVYYFDLENPSRIFPYLNHSVSNVSSWFVSNEFLLTALSEL